MNRLLLLDLHYTFAIDPAGVRSNRLVDRIPRETYRQWIIDLAAEAQATVVLTTARPEVYGDETLDRIKKVTGWEPDAADFRMIEAQPHVAKEDNLTRIIADYGQPTPGWVAFESNDRTRAMYRRHGIRSMPVHRTPPLTEWPDAGGTQLNFPFALP